MPFVCYPVQLTLEKIRCRKSGGKNTEMNKNSNFFVWNVFIYLYLTPNNHQAKVLLHQDGENAKSIWSFVSLK